MDHNLRADMENSSVLSIQHLQISSPKTFRKPPPPCLVSNLILYQVKLCQPTTQEFHVKYMYINEQTHKCHVRVFNLCIFYCMWISKLLIAMQNLCEYSISHEKSKDLNFILRFWIHDNFTLCEISWFWYSCGIWLNLFLLYINI